MNRDFQTGIRQQFQGYYKVGVVNVKTEEIEWKAEGKNLILNQGMDHLAASSIADQMTYGINGVGTRPNSQGSGVSEISQSGATVYLSNASGDITDFTIAFDAYPSLAQVGDMIAYSNGSQSIITSVTDATHLEVSPSYTFSPGKTFTVWKTSQVGLQVEISRSNSYFVGAGNCGSTVSANSVTHRRSYDFPVQNSPSSYNELGIGWASSGASTVFSRILTTPILVSSGFKLRLIYDLQATWQPTSSIYATASIGLWFPNSIGTQSLQSFLISTVDTNGNSVNSNAVLDPYYITSGGNWFSIWVSNNSESLAPFGSAVNRTSAFTYNAAGQSSIASYTAGSYLTDRTGITPTNFSSNTIRSIGFGIVNVGSGIYPASAIYQAFCFVFNQPQTLYNTQQLSLTFRQTWGRTLA